MNFLKMTLPTFILSYLIFYFIYKKLVGEKLRNSKIYKKVILLLLGLIFYTIGLEITDSFNTTKVYHSLFSGIFIGSTISIVPFIVQVDNIKKKS